MLGKKSGEEPSYLPSPSLAGDLLPSKRAIGQHKKILFCLSSVALAKGNRLAHEDLVAALEKCKRLLQEDPILSLIFLLEKGNRSAQEDPILSLMATSLQQGELYFT